eukprot:Skav221533  [mRNA]  locus=scaffold1813:20105:22727:+ [translate_table: standard]
MGAGSSVPPLPSEKTATGLAGQSCSSVEGDPKAGELQGSPQGVQWLLAAVDKEKEEKAWLAKKFEEKCAEVNTLQKELQRVRALLDQGQREHLEISPTSSPSKAGVAQRRGLQLSVQTAKNQPKVAFQIEDHNSSTKKDRSDRGAISRAKSSPAIGGDGIEPMSALLRRRQEARLAKQFSLENPLFAH